MKKKIRIRWSGTWNPSQKKAWAVDARWLAFLGGWGAGKTRFGARAFLRNVLLSPRNTDHLIVAPFWSTMFRTTLRAFERACPKRLVAKRSKKERYIELVGGRRVYYGSADRPETLDGPTCQNVWWDEARYARRIDAWRVVDSRLRAKTAVPVRGIITSTPGGWLEEQFGRGFVGRVTIHASTRENKAHLADGYIESLEASLSPRAAKVFIEGEFGLLEGAVYEDFDPKFHLLEWTYRPALRTVLAVDFGFNMPWAGFFQLVPQGTKLPNGRIAERGTSILFDELCPEKKSTAELALMVRETGYRVDQVICDPAGDGTQPALGISDVTILRENGFDEIRFQTAPRLRHIPFGVGLVQAALKDAGGNTRLWVAKSLDKPGAIRGAVKDLKAYAYPERKPGRPLSDEPVKDGLHDHSMDGLRYFMIDQAISHDFLPKGIPIL